MYCVIWLRTSNQTRYRDSNWTQTMSSSSTSLLSPKCDVISLWRHRRFQTGSRSVNWVYHTRCINCKCLPPGDVFIKNAVKDCFIFLSFVAGLKANCLSYLLSLKLKLFIWFICLCLNPKKIIIFYTIYNTVILLFLFDICFCKVFLHHCMAKYESFQSLFRISE